MPSQSPHPNTTPVVWIIHKQQRHRPLGISQLSPAKRCVSALSGKRDSSQSGSSITSTFPGHNSTPSSLLNNLGMADRSQHVTSTPPAAPWWSIVTPTMMSCSRSHSMSGSGRTTQTDSTPRIVSSRTSGIASTPTPVRSFQNLSSPIPNPGARMTITNPLRTHATERNQRQWQWQLQPQAVSTPRSVISSGRSIHWCTHWFLMRLVCAMGKLMELWMRNWGPFMSASNLEWVSYATWCAAKALADAPHWQIIEKYWNTARQKNNIWSIAFEAWPKKIVKEVCLNNGSHWILHA
jgi:hypothetical protein